MDKRVTYLETGSHDPAYNLAFEEFVLSNRRDGDYLLLWQNHNTIVVGQNQKTEEEINRPFVEEHQIQVIRRNTGGGAVYHDLGNLNYSFITDLGDQDHLTMERFTRPVVEALRALGLDAEASGRNDILVSGRKVSGTAERITRGRILHHGTLLFDSNPEMVAGALHVDSQKFRSKSTKSVRSRIGNIRDFLPKDMDLLAFWTYLKKYLAGNGMEQGNLSVDELMAVEKLRQEKYDQWDWNFGRSPQYDFINKEYWDGGSLEVRLSVSKGRIQKISFRGDFLSTCSLDGVTDALRGCLFRRKDVSAVLERFPLKCCFGTIRKGEVLDTMFRSAPKAGGSK